jgi:hypothetical protein
MATSLVSMGDQNALEGHGGDQNEALIAAVK